MDKQHIFNNYLSQCPYCGADLDSSHITCPYCGEDLNQYNFKHRCDEQDVFQKLEEVETYKKDINRVEDELVESQKYWSRKTYDMVKDVFVSIFAILVSSVLVYIMLNLQSYCEDLDFQTIKEFLITNQSVDTIEVEDTISRDMLKYDKAIRTAYVVDADCCNSGLSNYLSNGLVRYNESTIMFPFHAHSYSDSIKFEGVLYVKKFDEKLSYDFSVYENSIIKSDSYVVNLRFYIDDWYSSKFDVVRSHSSSSTIKRLDDIVVGDYRYEAYFLNNEYYFVCDPYAHCYIELIVRPADNAQYDEEDIVNLFMIQAMDAKFANE